MQATTTIFIRCDATFGSFKTLEEFNARFTGKYKLVKGSYDTWIMFVEVAKKLSWLERLVRLTKDREELFWVHERNIIVKEEEIFTCSKNVTNNSEEG